MCGSKSQETHAGAKCGLLHLSGFITWCFTASDIQCVPHWGTDAPAHVSSAKHTNTHCGGRQLNKLPFSLSVITPLLPLPSVFQNNSWRVGAVTTEECARWRLTVVLFQMQRAAFSPGSCRPFLKGAVRLLRHTGSAEAPISCRTKTSVKMHRKASGKKQFSHVFPTWSQWIHCRGRNQKEASILLGHFTSRLKNKFAVSNYCLSFFLLRRQNHLTVTGILSPKLRASCSLLFAVVI